VALLRNIDSANAAAAAAAVVYFENFICEKKMHFFRPFFSFVQVPA
jgi:hypothetical protein